MPSGHIIYGVGGTLRAVGFDLDRLEVTSDPIPVVNGVNMKRTGVANFAVAQNGSLVYVEGSGTGTAVSLVWVDREGREEPLPVAPGNYRWPRVSPDGRQVAISNNDDDADVWISELTRGTPSRLTTHPETDTVPLWTPGGEHVVFASGREGTGALSLFQRSADGTGSVEKLFTGPGPGHLKPYGWSPDGMNMVFDYGQVPNLDIGVLTMDGDETWEPLLRSEALEGAPTLSPDGTWIEDDPGVVEGRW